MNFALAQCKGHFGALVILKRRKAEVPHAWPLTGHRRGLGVFLAELAAFREPLEAETPHRDLSATTEKS